MDSYSNKSKAKNTNNSVWFLVGLAVWWLWTPALYLFLFLVQKVLFTGIGPWNLALYQFSDYVWKAGGFNGTALRDLWIIIGAIGTIVIGLLALTNRNSRPMAGLVSVLGVLVLLFGLVTWFRAVWDDDKDVARYYASQNVFVVPDINNVPSAMTKLISNNTKSANCDLAGPHGDDVPACINKGVYSEAGWQPRVSSLDGAQKVMRRSSGTVSGVNLDEGSITYLNGADGSPARWTGVRDGSGRTNPMQGVVEWDGTNNPVSCTFTGNNKIDRAVHGKRGNSLKNLLNDKFPRLQFEFDEYWGYCDKNKEPVIVFPVQQQQHFKLRTVNAPAGVVTMRGSSSGGAAFTYETNVKAGEFPGPVYSRNVVDKQIVSTQWAGGRKIRDNTRFGFDLADSSVQEGNNGDYLLESNVDHRLYWVNPLTPGFSDAQQYVAYAATPADSVSYGKLNTTKIYVVADNDARQTNLDNLVADARTFVARENPGFFTAGGKLVEFLPTHGDIFRAYGEQNGRVVYRLDISATRKVAPVLVPLDADTGTVTDTPQTGTGSTPTPTSGSSGTPDCNKPNTLTTKQLAYCYKILTDALDKEKTAK